ncbi:MAG: HIRAN domain-containing protein [Bacteroidales bacterium]|nr:HIRAN domain-containing protein [Bacteroidales bacterium]
MKNRYFKHFFIAGFTYCDGVDVFQNLKIGTQLKLVAESDNKYDANAVALYYGEVKLGFIPRAVNKEISILINSGYDGIFEAHINRVVPKANPEEQIGVLLRIVEAK